MSDYVDIRPCSGPLNAAIRPPGSKSLTNRALVCAALAEGRSLLRGALDSEDTQVMIAALARLGFDVEHDASAATIAIAGRGGRIPADEAQLHVGNSGTTMRFLAGLLALGKGPYEIDGVPRMRKRPIGDLIGSLAALGASIRSIAGDDCPPIEVGGRLAGGKTQIRGDVSSQFLSGLLMVAPYALAPVEIEVQGALVSQPYVRMTLTVMREFAVEIDHDRQGLSWFRAGRAHYTGREYEIEPDASAASYFFAAAAIAGGRVTVEGLSRASLQGDVGFVDCLAAMGCEVRDEVSAITVTGRPLRGIDVDMTHISDTVQTLAAVACFAEGPTTIRGVGHIRHKETDRIGDLARELRKLGVEVVERDDGLTIEPRPCRGASIETYNDHRMAMSLALVGLKTPGVRILNPGCTAKTYPAFFADLERVTGSAS